MFAAGFRDIYLAQQADPARIGFSANDLVLFFGFAFAVFGIIFVRFHFPLKQVELEDQTLYVSNYLREIQVPLRDVESVKQGFWFTRAFVTIWLRTQTDLGRRIVFIPPRRWSASWDRDPVVGELRAMVEQAQALREDGPGQVG